MYPVFFIPPYSDGGKYKTVLNQTPKTHIPASNMYELEILRLLCLLAPKDPGINTMTGKTLFRLKTTCFGYMDDGTGECFDTSLIVLRFLTAAAPNDKEWIQNRIDNYNRHFPDKKRPSYCLWYYRLCLSELPSDIAEPEISKYKAEMLNLLNDKNFVGNGESGATTHSVLLSILRNALAQCPDQAHIKNAEKDRNRILICTE